jgi:hypothetical protein
MAEMVAGVVGKLAGVVAGHAMCGQCGQCKKQLPTLPTKERKPAKEREGARSICGQCGQCSHCVSVAARITSHCTTTLYIYFLKI